MNICIVYEMNNREFNNCVLLERELLRRGHNVKICNKTEDVNFFKLFDVVMIPNSYRTSDVDGYRYIFSPGNRIMVVYPCEQVVNRFLPDFYEHTTQNKVKHLPHLCWGEDYYSWINELGYDMSCTSIVGALQLDFCRPIFREIYSERQELANHYGLDNNKKWILFISDFVLMNELRFEQYINAGALDRKTLTKRRDFEEKSKNEILSWLITFLKENNDYQVIYRKHPVEILTEEMEQIRDESPDKFFLISELNIKEWIMNCDYVTTWNSTALIECYAADVKVGLLRPYSFSEEPAMNEYAFYSHYQSITSYSEFENCIRKGLYEYNKDTIQEINQFYSILEVPTFVRIADAIEKIAMHSELIHKEKNYLLHRVSYCLCKHVYLKTATKKLFQLMYGLTGIKPRNTDKKRVAFTEWVLSVDNKKAKKKLATSIDKVIREWHEKNDTL